MILKRFESLEKTDNGYLIHGDCADVMVVFLSDDVIRVRTSFTRQFPEASYTLVTTACSPGSAPASPPWTCPVRRRRKP